MQAVRAAVVALFLLGVLAVPLVAADDEDDTPVAEPPPSTVPLPPPTTAPSTTTTAAPRPTTSAYRGPVTRVRGRVVDDGGRPVAGVEVHVYADEGLAGLGRIAAGIASLGTFCNQSPPPLACRDSGQATTGRDGAYTVELRASPDELKASPMFVSASRSGASVRRPVALSSAAVQVPDLPLWDPAFRFEGGRATWRPVSASGASYSIRLQRADPTGDVLVIAYPTEPSLELDPRVLEDFAVGVSLTAKAGELSFTAPDATVRGPGLPPTRDRPCELVPDDAGTPPVRYERCPATDTDPFSRLDARPAAHAFVVDLGASRPLSFAFVRDMSDDPLFVDVSEDGTEWVELVRFGPTDVAPTTRTAQAPEPRSGRYVRFRSGERFTGFFALRAAAAW